MSILKSLYEKRDINPSLTPGLKKQIGSKFRPGNIDYNQNKESDIDAYIIIGQANGKSLFKTIALKKDYKINKTPYVQKGGIITSQISYSIERSRSKEALQCPPVSKKNIFEATLEDVFHRKTIDFNDTPNINYKSNSSTITNEKILINKSKQNSPRVIYPCAVQKIPNYTKHSEKKTKVEQTKVKDIDMPTLFQEKLLENKSNLQIVHSDSSATKHTYKKILSMAANKEILQIEKEAEPLKINHKLEQSLGVQEITKDDSENLNKKDNFQRKWNIFSKNTLIIPTELKKTYKRANLLYNLFLGISVEVKPNKKGSAPLKLKFGLGNGNNDKLVMQILNAKGMDFENFFSKCNLIWTQSTGKRTALANLGTDRKSVV